MKNHINLLLLCTFFLFLFTGCFSKYNESDFVGKTSVQIETEFGLFDCCGMPSGEDGLYRNTACGYIIKEQHTSFLGTDPQVLLFISFNEDGLAVSCEEGYRPGG